MSRRLSAPRRSAAVQPAVEGPRGRGLFGDEVGRGDSGAGDEVVRAADVVITMGCGDACPYVPGLIRDDWPLADPKGKSLDEVRSIREDIRRRVEALITKERW